MSESNTDALEVIAASNERFSLKLYEILRETPGNVFFSPTSLEVLLALAHFGAKGKTAEEILSGLALPNDVNLVKSGYNAIMNSLKSTDDMTLEIANKVYSENSFAVEQEFQLLAEKSFLAAAENLDFIGEPDKSRIVMNTWVEKQTNDKIKNLIGEGDITIDSRMVLINAVYFKGKWRYPFNSIRTVKEPFLISATESKKVDMMYIQKMFGYLELNDMKAKMLVMPYEDNTMFMVILLPNEIDGLEEMEKKLHFVKIHELMKTAQHLEVNVSLPKFKIEKTMDLVEPLKKLGISSMFDEKEADFSRISKKPGLFVNKVIQKAFIEVNETGTEAAVASGFEFRFQCWRPPPQEFHANKPFLFQLVNFQNSIILFQGLYTAKE